MSRPPRRHRGVVYRSPQESGRMCPLRLAVARIQFQTLTDFKRSYSEEEGKAKVSTMH